MKKSVVILGSTGSIGKSLLDIITRDKQNFKILLLTANKNYKLLLQQAKLYNVKNILISDKYFFEKAKSINVFNNYKLYVLSRYLLSIFFNNNLTFNS